MPASNDASGSATSRAVNVSVKIASDRFGDLSRRHRARQKERFMLWPITLISNCLPLAYSITTDRSGGAIRVAFTSAALASQGTMSSGESRAVSIQRRHGSAFQLRQLEVERLPVGVQDEVEATALLCEARRRAPRCANRRPSPAG